MSLLLLEVIFAGQRYPTRRFLNFILLMALQRLLLFRKLPFPSLFWWMELVDRLQTMMKSTYLLCCTAQLARLDRRDRRAKWGQRERLEFKAIPVQLEPTVKRGKKARLVIRARRVM